jgi:hypothetical protein
MPAVATSRLRLIKQETYSNPDAWGVYLNSGALDMADQAFGVAEIAVGANVSLDTQNFVSDEARRLVLILSGAGGFSVTAPAVDKPYLVINDCAADVTIGPFGGSFATVRAGTQVWYTTNAAGTVGRVVDPTLDKVKKPAASVDFNGQRAVNMADPVDPQDGLTLNYLNTQFVTNPDLGTVAAIADEVRTVAHIQDGTVATDAVTDVAAISGEIVDLSGITADIVQLAGMFVGASATDPATRLDGTPLQAGDYYLNTTGTPTVRVYSGAAWIPIEAVAVASKSEAETGSDNSKMMTPLRVKEARQGAVGTEIFTTSGMFTKKDKAAVYLVEVIGGGGGGGGGASVVAGSDGGTTSFGTIVVATGGRGGGVGNNSLGGVGGGGGGDGGAAITGNNAKDGNLGGGGGAAFRNGSGTYPGGLGRYGGNGGTGSTSTPSYTAATNGTAPGGGGGGGIDASNTVGNRGAGGGGGGGNFSLVPAADMPSSVTVTIGSGGSAASAGAGAGARGEVRVYWW